MRQIRTALIRAALPALVAAPLTSHAVNGVEPGGHGVENASMGGASIALPLDAISPANNPAGISQVPDSVALNLQIFRGRSTADYVMPGNRLSNLDIGTVPEWGANWHASSSVTIGMAMAAEGAGCRYDRAELPLAGATAPKDTIQVAEVLPTVAWKPVETVSLGLSFDAAYERVESEGVIVPAPVPGGLAELPTHGTRSAHGHGVRAGLLWSPSPSLSIGLNIRSHVHMGALSGYSEDLLASSAGHLDLPSESGVGVAWRPATGVTVAADVLQLRWGRLGIMQDPNGFHWRDQTVLRMGGAWDLSSAWTVRAGYSRNNGGIPATNIDQNLLLPSTVRQAVSAGVTWHMTQASEATLGYELDPTTTVHGTGTSTGTTLHSNAQLFLMGWQTRF
jgi:long-chain fatty acid transport protein